MTLRFLPFSRLARLAALLLTCALAACSSLPGPDEASQSPFLRSPGTEPGIERLIVVIPGAFASVGIFAPIIGWDLPEDTGLLAYRFPGSDHLPLDHHVDIRASGAMIAQAARDLGAREVYLVGFSTGGPIAIEAAQGLRDRKVKLALISSASGMPAGAMASVRGAVDMLRARLRAGGGTAADTLTENYRTLLYGNGGLDGDTGVASAAEAEAQRKSMTRPSLRATMAQTASLLSWTLTRPAHLEAADIAFFHGGGDTVFPPATARAFARRVGADRFYLYEGRGHLLYVTTPRVFSDIRDFFEF